MRFTIFAALLVSGLLSGCVTSPVHLTLTPQVKPDARKSHAAQSTQIFLQPIEDRRPTAMRQHLGSIAGRTVTCSYAADWIAYELGQLNSQHFLITTQSGTAGNGANGWRMKATILQMFMASVDVSKNSNIVLEIELQAPDGTISKQNYRGRSSRGNWASGSGEIEGSIREAMQSAMNQIKADIESTLSKSPKAQQDRS